MTKCTQPGCTGTIVDGYCDVCGSPGPAETPPDTPAQAPAATPSAAHPSAGPSAAAPGAASTPDLEGTPCTQPGCTGTIVDGY